MGMEWYKLISDRRLGKVSSEGRAENEISGVGRGSNFERDYDRLIFSSPFRRLQNKAQVFPLPGNVFVHNRLTHSLEVSCVGRSLGNIVAQRLLQKDTKLDFLPSSIASIVSSACLAHDLGNPPFGHSGERAISSYFKEGDGKKWKAQVLEEGGRWSDFEHFEGNANTFRLLTHQFQGRQEGGFCLTYTTLASVVKYPYSSLDGAVKGKFGFFATEEADFEEIAEHLGLIRLSEGTKSFARHPFVFLVEAADDICYQLMDLEDACKLRILTYPEVQDLMLSFFEEKDRGIIENHASVIEDNNERLAYIRAKVINRLVEQCADVFLENEKGILDGTFKTPLIKHTDAICYEAYKKASQVAQKKIYINQDVVDVELAGHHIFSEIIDRMMFALLNPNNAYSRPFLSRVSSQYNTKETTLYGKIQCTLDFLSGMTDLYALDLYRKLTGMNLPYA